MHILGSLILSYGRAHSNAQRQRTVEASWRCGSCQTARATQLASWQKRTARKKNWVSPVLGYPWVMEGAWGGWEGLPRIESRTWYWLAIFWSTFRVGKLSWLPESMTLCARYSPSSARGQKRGRSQVLRTRSLSGVC